MDERDDEQSGNRCGGIIQNIIWNALYPQEELDPVYHYNRHS